MNEVWLMLPVFLPVLLGLIFPYIKCLKNRQQKIGYVGASLVLCGVLSLMIVCNFGQETSFTLRKLTDALTVYFRIDDVSKLFAVLTTFVWVIVGFYAFGYMKHEEEEERFYRYYLIVYGVLLGLDFSGNLITMYLFYEMMTLSSLPLVLHSRTKEAVMAGLKYLFYSIAGAFLSLLAIFFFYQYGTTMEFTAGGVLNMAKVAGNEPVLLVVIFLAIIGLAVRLVCFLYMHGFRQRIRWRHPRRARYFPVLLQKPVYLRLSVLYFSLWVQTLSAEPGYSMRGLD